MEMYQCQNNYQPTSYSYVDCDRDDQYDSNQQHQQQRQPAYEENEQKQEQELNCAIDIVVSAVAICETDENLYYHKAVNKQHQYQNQHQQRPKYSNTCSPGPLLPTTKTTTSLSMSFLFRILLVLYIAYQLHTIVLHKQLFLTFLVISNYVQVNNQNQIIVPKIIKSQSLQRTITIQQNYFQLFGSSINEQKQQQKQYLQNVISSGRHDTNDTINNNIIAKEYRHGKQQQQQQEHRHKRKLTSSASADSINPNKRILYIITTLAEYNTGTRNTKRGSDRLQETTIPIIKESVTRMIQSGYTVDVYLICHYTLRPERQALLQSALDDISHQLSNTNNNNQQQQQQLYHNNTNIQLTVWNDATPLGYDTGLHTFVKLEYRTLHLSRQHRFVIKDNILNYDLFVNFEDDMLITGTHVDHFVAVTNEIDRLIELATDDDTTTTNVKLDQIYAGSMTRGQLRRIIPGFIRVEVLTDETTYPAQSNTGPVPVDLNFHGSTEQVDSTICCSVSSSIATTNRPQYATSDQLMIWETNIIALGIRQMPIDSWLNWVVLLRGPNQNSIPSNTIIGDYWSNRNLQFYPITKRRPQPMEFKYINNQGGWMGTVQQILNWHTNICSGSFLPPYNVPHFRYDGLDQRNVEWYSGGMQLSTVRHACNMQRIVLIEPTNFSKSLLYHTANNKQRQLSSKRETSFTKANTLLGQLNTIKKIAETELN